MSKYSGIIFGLLFFSGLISVASALSEQIIDFYAPDEVFQNTTGYASVSVFVTDVTPQKPVTEYVAVYGTHLDGNKWTLLCSWSEKFATPRSAYYSCTIPAYYNSDVYSIRASIHTNEREGCGRAYFTPTPYDGCGDYEEKLVSITNKTRDVAIQGLLVPPKVYLNEEFNATVVLVNLGDSTETFTLSSWLDSVPGYGGPSPSPMPSSSPTPTPTPIGGCPSLMLPVPVITLSPKQSYSYTYPDVSITCLSNYAFNSRADVAYDVNYSNNFASQNIVVNDMVHDIYIDAISNLPQTVNLTQHFSPIVGVRNLGDFTETVALNSSFLPQQGNSCSPVYLPLVNITVGAHGKVSMTYLNTSLNCSGNYSFYAIAPLIGDVNLSNNNKSQNIVVLPNVAVHDLAITNVSLPVSVSEGKRFEFFVTVKNVGDSFEKTVLKTSFAPVNGTQCDQLVLRDEYVTLLPGFGETFEYWTQIDCDGKYLFTASVPLVDDATPLNNNATKNITVTPNASAHDLSITNISLPVSVNQSQYFSFSVSVKNQGNFSENATLHASFNPVNGSQCDPLVFYDQSLNLTPGNITNQYYYARLECAGTYVLNASVPLAGDVTPWNNNANKSIIVTANNTGVHDLSITNVSLPVSVPSDQYFDVFVRVENHGNFDENTSLYYSFFPANGSFCNPVHLNPQPVILSAGGFSSYASSARLTCAGNYSFTAEVPVNGDITPENNQVIRQIVVTSANPLHDVYISNAYVEDRVSVNKSFWVNVSGGNAGTYYEQASLYRWFTPVNGSCQPYYLSPISLPLAPNQTFINPYSASLNCSGYYNYTASLSILYDQMPSNNLRYKVIYAQP